MDWDSNTVVTVNGLLKMYCTFSFIYSFIVTMNCMSVIKPVSIKLQYKTNDIVYAYMKITNLVDELQKIRANDQMLHAWYVQAESLSVKFNVEPSVPRTTSRQLGQDNVEYSSTEEYYRRVTALPFLDHLIQQMKERFGNYSEFVSKLLSLVPSVLCDDSNSSLSLHSMVDFYSSDLPSPAVVGTEVSRWKMKWEHQKNLPSTLGSTLKECDNLDFPNIHTLLWITCTLHVRMRGPIALSKISRQLCVARWARRRYLHWP